MIRMGMHLSLWAPEWTSQAGELALKEAAKHGLSVIEVPLLSPERLDVGDARARFDHYGIAPSASLCLPANAMAQRDPEAATEFLLRALDAAYRLGCSYLGGVTYTALGFTSGLPPTQAEYDNIAQALAPVARRAADMGLEIGLEPCNRYETHLLNTAAQTLALIERIGAPNLIAHMDTYHMNIEEKGIGRGLEEAGSYARYVHLSESDRGVPGTGTIDWNEVFAALAKNKVDRDLVIESFVAIPVEIAAALSIWRPVAKDRFEVLDKGVPFLMAKARRFGLM